MKIADPIFASQVINTKEATLERICEKGTLALGHSTRRKINQGSQDVDSN